MGSNLTAGFSKMSSVVPSSLSKITDEKLRIEIGQDGRKTDFDLKSIYKQYYDYKATDEGTRVPIIPPYNKGEKLPILEKHNEIIEKYATHQVLLISGETGSGKSTIVPQILLDQCVIEDKGALFWVTQPRRIAASTIAERVAQSRPRWGKCGNGIVGYHVGLEKNVSRDARIVYMTPGIVSNKMQSDRLLEQVSCLIIDEVHERDLETDMLLLLVRKLIEQNPKSKVILMSATLDTGRYEDYFSLNGVKPAIIHAKGRQYEIEQWYAEDITKSLHGCQHIAYKAAEGTPELSTPAINYCINILRNLNKLEQERNDHDRAPGAVLIFLPGLYEINSLQMTIRRGCPESEGYAFQIERLHSNLPRDRDTMRRIIEPVRNKVRGKYRRKIVLSTNMGESSITIIDVKYVIDFCLTKYTIKHNATKLPQLTLRWASRDMCDQRCGRAGRLRPGICFRLVDRDFFERRMLKTQPEEITRVPLDYCVLLGKSVFPLLTPGEFLEHACAKPTEADIDDAVRTLKEIGALTMGNLSVKRKNGGDLTSEDLKDGELTPFGRLLNLLPLDRSCVRLIQLGYMTGLVFESIIIAACTSVGAFWNYNRDVVDDLKDQDEFLNAYRSRLFWARGTNSDHIAMLNAFVSWYQKMPDEYCKNYTRREHRFPKMIRNPKFPTKILQDQEIEMKWTQKNGLNAKALREVHLIVEDIIGRLTTNGFYLGEETSLVNRKTHILGRTQKELNSYTALLKIIIAGSCYPYFFKLSEIEETETIKDSNNFNGNTTIYFKGIPPQDNYKFGKDVLRNLRNCGTVSKLYFDDTRMFVEFAPDLDHASIFSTRSSMKNFQSLRPYNELTNVLPSVMCAMKLGRKRQDNSFLEVNISEELVPTDQGSRFYYFKVLDLQGRMMTPRRRHHAKEFQIECSYVESLVEFWGVETVGDRHELENLIKDYSDKGLLQGFQGQIPVLSLVLAPFTEGNCTTYHRALVLCSTMSGYCDTEGCWVRFVDHGDCQFRAPHDLKAIPVQDNNNEINIHNHPWLAIKYRIQGVQLRHENNLRRYQNGFHLGKFYTVDIYSTYTGEVVLADVYDGETNMADLLLAEGFCDLHEENSADVLDNMRWKGQSSKIVITTDSGLPRATTADSDSTSSPEATQNKRWVELKDITTDTGFNTATRTDTGPSGGENKDGTRSMSRRQKIQGPYNMYRTKVGTLFKGLHNSEIQTSSINSVICNPRPISNNRTLVVGQDVSVVQGDNVQPTFTTMMPNIKGIIPLCYLIFSPRYELRLTSNMDERIRRNRDKSDFEHTTLYTGALFGLGAVKAKTVKPIYSDHDVEISFDVEIDDHDVESCREIKKTFNRMFGDEESFKLFSRNPKEVERSQKRLSEQLLSLLFRPRQNIQPIETRNKFKWNSESTDERDVYLPRYDKRTLQAGFGVPMKKTDN